MKSLADQLKAVKAAKNDLRKAWKDGRDGGHIDAETLQEMVEGIDALIDAAATIQKVINFTQEFQDEVSA